MRAFSTYGARCTGLLRRTIAKGRLQCPSWNRIVRVATDMVAVTSLILAGHLREDAMESASFKQWTRRRQLAAVSAGSGAALAACAPELGTSSTAPRGPLSGDMEFWFHWAPSTAGYYEAMERSATWFREEN